MYTKLYYDAIKHDENTNEVVILTKLECAVGPRI